MLSPTPDSIHCCDWLELARALPDASVDMALVDMPYNELNNIEAMRGNGGLRMIHRGQTDNWEGDLSVLCSELMRISKGWIALFCGIEQVSQIRKAFNNAGLLTRHCVWKKSNPSPMNCQYHFLSDTENCIVARKSGAPFQAFYTSSVWNFKAGTSDMHPTQKPLELFQFLINACTLPGQLVFDPFVGSGTTAVAAKGLGRRYICGDQSAEYVEIARARVSDTKIIELDNGRTMEQPPLFALGD